MIAMGERDAQAAMEAFEGRAHRLVVLSSGDVYRAYGRFIGLEPGPVEKGLLTESSHCERSFIPIVTGRGPLTIGCIPTTRSLWNESFLGTLRCLPSCCDFRRCTAPAKTLISPRSTSSGI